MCKKDIADVHSNCAYLEIRPLCFICILQLEIKFYSYSPSQSYLAPLGTMFANDILPKAHNLMGNTY
jgi:hypothetical protein